MIPKEIEDKWFDLMYLIDEMEADYLHGLESNILLAKRDGELDEFIEKLNRRNNELFVIQLHMLDVIQYLKEHKEEL